MKVCLEPGCGEPATTTRSISWEAALVGDWLTGAGAYFSTRSGPRYQRAGSGVFIVPGDGFVLPVCEDHT